MGRGKAHTLNFDLDDIQRFALPVEESVEEMRQRIAIWLKKQEKEFARVIAPAFIDPFLEQVMNKEEFQSVALNDHLLEERKELATLMASAIHGDISQGREPFQTLQYSIHRITADPGVTSSIVIIPTSTQPEIHLRFDARATRLLCNAPVPRDASPGAHLGIIQSVGEGAVCKECLKRGKGLDPLNYRQVTNAINLEPNYLPKWFTLRDSALEETGKRCSAALAHITKEKGSAKELRRALTAAAGQSFAYMQAVTVTDKTGIHFHSTLGSPSPLPQNSFGLGRDTLELVKEVSAVLKRFQSAWERAYGGKAAKDKEEPDREKFGACIARSVENGFTTNLALARLEFVGRACAEFYPEAAKEWIKMSRGITDSPTHYLLPILRREYPELFR
jgi:hypothetical protein